MHDSFYICARWYVFVITQKTTICLTRLLGKWQRKNIYHTRWCRVFRALALMASDDRQAWGKWESMGGDLESFVCKNRKKINELSKVMDSMPIMYKL